MIRYSVLMLILILSKFPTLSWWDKWPRRKWRCCRPCWIQVLAIEKPMFWCGAKTSAQELVLDIPIFARKGPVETLWRVLHCFIVNDVTGRENLKLGRHIVQYAVWVSSRDYGAMLMLCILLSACCWQCKNSSTQNPSGDKRTPSVCLPMFFLLLGLCGWMLTCLRSLQVGDLWE